MAAKSEGVSRAWISALRTGALARAYVFYGEERYRRRTALGFLKRRLIAAPGAEWDYVELRDKTVTAEDIAEAVSTPPVAAPCRLIVTREFDPLKSGTEVLFAALPEDVCLVMDMPDPDWRPDRRSKLYKAMEKTVFFAQFDQASPEELGSFMRRCFSDRGKTIDPAEISYMIFCCSNLMDELLSEIEKVAANARGPRVTRADIDAVATRRAEARVFDMTDAVAAGDWAKALAVLSELEAARESAVGVTAMIGRQMRQLYYASLALGRGHNRRQIMDALGIGYPFLADKLISAARRMNPARIRLAVVACLEADEALKSSRAEPFDVVRMLICRIAAGESEAAG
jgi:DNA polymerase-3 subunit delta